MGNSPDLIFITTQGDDVLLASNNEYSKDGDWHPEWTNKPESFYLREDVKILPALAQVLLFYAHHPQCLLSRIWAKVERGFFVSFAQLLFYLTAIFVLLARIFGRMNIFNALLLLALITIILAYVFSPVSVHLFYYEVKALLHYNNMVTVGISFFMVVVVIYTLLSLKINPVGNHFLQLLLFNFLLLCVVFYGSPRIHGTVDFIFLLLTFHLLFASPLLQTTRA